MRKLVIRFAAALLAATIPLLAAAQSFWPAQPVKLIVPYPPGGTTDFSARLIGQKLGDLLGQPFVIEYKPGATGTIGAQQVASARPDGYTMLANDMTYAMLPALLKKLPWEHAESLVPVTTLVVAPMVLAVPAGSPFKSLGDLVDYARNNPGKLNFGSGGVGSSSHLNGELFSKEAAVHLTHVPYKGGGDALRGIMSGEIDLLIAASPTLVSQFKGGRVRAIAVSGAVRSAAFVDVPTFGEGGVPGYGVTSWFGLFAPKGTPSEVIGKLHAETVRALADSAVKEKIAQQGAETGGLAPDKFARFVAEETKRWGNIARAAGIKPE